MIEETTEKGDGEEEKDETLADEKAEREEQRLRKNKIAVCALP